MSDWIMQMLISNMMYNLVVCMIVVNVVCSCIMQCPAVMLAASRKPRVTGQTMILIYWIMIRNGFSLVIAVDYVVYV